jgi:hypothetical protein
MKPERKRELAIQYYLAYSEAANEIEAQKLKDNAYEITILIGGSLFETVNLNSKI